MSGTCSIPRSAGPSAWQGTSAVPTSSISDLDKAALAKLAQASMDEIAEFLTASKSETSSVPETPIQTAEVSDDEPAVAMQ